MNDIKAVFKFVSVPSRLLWTGTPGRDDTCHINYVAVWMPEQLNQYVYKYFNKYLFKFYSSLKS